MINVHQPSLGAEELAAIEKVFASNWLGKGRLTAAFEDEYAEHVGVGSEHVLTTNCCTEGLFSSMELMDIQPGDEVIVPATSFVGAGNAVCARGATMVLCDVDKRTQNATAADIEKAVTSKTKAILLNHYGGVPCEMDAILTLADACGLKVVEDAACGVSSRYKGKAIGTFGDMGMWSFDAMKILVCGDGAMLYFKDPELREKATKYLYFGLESKSGYSNSVDKKWWEFDISCFGHRSIMNDITASMALEQLKKLPSFIAARRDVHERYTKQLNDVSWFMTPKPLKDYEESSYYFYPIQLYGEDRDVLAKYLRENDIYTTYRYFPLHRVQGYGVSADCPNADWAADHTLCLPMHQSLSEADVDYVCEKVREYGAKRAL